MSFEFWKDKRVLITGHTGFKGSWLSLWLEELGARVFGYSLKSPSEPSMFELAQVGRGMTSFIKDIRDFDSLSAVIKECRPEIVIHMAAQALVRQSYENPIETYQVNVMGTINLLEALRKTGETRVIVNVTSDKCYRNEGWVWGYREFEALGGHDPYSNSKACSELVTACFRDSFFQSANSSGQGLAVGSARAGNVIGGGDWAKDRLIPDCVRAWLNSETVNIRYPHAVRPWQFVLEPLSGYMLLAEKLWENSTAFAGAWNFGPGDASARSVEDVLTEFGSLWGQGAKWQIDKNAHPHEAHYLKLDCSKAKTNLGWIPRWDLKTSLEKTAAWYKVYQNSPQALRDTTLKQIRQYMEVCSCR